MSAQKSREKAMSDEYIIALYWSREEEAIRATDLKYGRMLFRIAFNILHDESDCDECKNDTYLGVWNSIPPTRPTAFSSFITRIMRNTACNRYREKRSQKRVPSELTVSLESLGEVFAGHDLPETHHAAAELGRLISEYVGTLSDRQKYIFIGRFYMAETIAYLANRLGVGIGTVHRDIEKIKQGLRKYLKRNGVNI